MCKMCEQEPASFTEYDLNISSQTGTEKYLSAGENLAHAAFLSGFKMASRTVLEALEAQGLVASQDVAQEALEQAGTRLLSAEITMVEHVRSPLEKLIMALMEGIEVKIINLDEPATPEEEETFPEDDYDGCGDPNCPICD